MVQIRKKIVTLVGTRPELIKLSPVIPLMMEAFDHHLVHSGQHYSFAMDAIFFEELHLPKPSYHLDVGAGTHAEQTAWLMMRFERVLLREDPAVVIALGDTNTTLAGILTAAKLHIPTVHIEAGCRSFNRQMPEEVNRVVVDHISTWCFAPGEREARHLLQEGIPASRIYRVGSTAIDACLRNQALSEARTIVQDVRRDLGLSLGSADSSLSYVLLTLHRALNTVPKTLRGIMDAVNHLAARWPFVFPVHPRTRQVLASLQENTPPLRLHPNIHLLEPVGYLDMLQLVKHARAVMTDSGGLQEEAATLGIPLLVVRRETEWDYLVEAGAAVLLGNTFSSIVSQAESLLTQGRSAFQQVDMQPQQGAAERITSTLQELLA
jgi:UDP-N-acetylglucosamine 2-epimerase (non-hydrolysing)